MLLDSIKTRFTLMRQLGALEEEQHEIEETISHSKTGRVIVGVATHPGVKVKIHTSVYKVDHVMKCVTFYREGGGIVAGATL
jgi:hypothetical protein